LFKKKVKIERNIKSGIINLNKLIEFKRFIESNNKIEVSMPIGARLKIK
jgi:hypothetical protein